MPRIRTIKPDFYVDERIADLSYPAAFHFPGLWLLADRAGRLLDRPREIKAKIAPLRDVDMEAVLVELEAAKMVLRYVVNDEKYLEVCNLERHQRFNSREPPSLFPPPNPPGVARKRMHARARTRTHMQDGEEGKGMEGNGREGNGTAVLPDPTFGFEHFWASYRKKTHREEALEAWVALKPAPALRAQIIAAVTWQFRQARWLEDGCQYAPNGATYLHKKRWTDEPPPAAAVGLSEREAKNLAAAQRFIQAGKGET